MRIFVTVLILILSVQCWTKADDIGDYEIEGMSVGDSLLKFYSKNEIQTQLSKTSSTYSKTDILRVYFNIQNPELYGTVNIHFINDENYEIVSIGGIEYFRNDMKNCYKKQNIVINEIEEVFPKADKSKLNKSKHTSDPTGKSSVRDTWFNLSNGQIYISCTDWSDQMTKKHNWTDNLGIYLESFEYIRWLQSL